MLTAGESLKQRRLELKLTFTQVSATTKIPVETLKALEKNQFALLPDYTFLKGIVRNYALSLELDPVKIVAAFKRDYDRTQSVPAAPLKPLGSTPLRSWLEKPATLFLAGVILFIGLVVWSLWRVYQPPRLIINTPVAGQSAVSPVAIAGRNDRDATLTINGKTVNLEPDGSFTLEYPAEPGQLELKFTATSRRKKTSEKTVTVIIIE